MNRADRRRLIRNGTTGRLGVYTATGLKVEARHKFNADLPEVPPGEHLWVMINTYRILHPERLETEQFNADLENLLSVDGPGCLVCEQPWRPGIGPCQGEASPELNYRRRPDD